MRVGLTWLLGAAVALAPTALLASPPRVAVAPADGAKSQRVWQAALRPKIEGVELVGAATVAAAAREFGLDLGRAEDRLSLARALGAQGILSGELGRRGRFTTTLRAPSSDAVIGRITNKLGRRRPRPAKLRRVLRDWLPENAKALPPLLPDARIVMLEVSGRGDRKTRSAVRRAVARMPALTLVASGQAETAAEQHPGGLYSPEGRAQAARELDVQGFLRVRLKKKGRRLTARLELIGGTTGTFVDTRKVAARGRGALAAAVADALTRMLAARLPAPRGLAVALNRTSPVPAADPTPEPEPAPEPEPTAELDPAPTPETAPETEPTSEPAPEPAPEPEPTPEPAADPAPPAPEPAPEPEPEVIAEAPPAPPAPARTATPAPARPSTARPARALEIKAGLGVASRNLRYVDDLFEELRPYDLSAAPVVAAQLAWFPAAHLGRTAWAGLGIEGRFAQTIGVQSEDNVGRTFGTTALAFDAGLRYRLDVGDHAVGLGVGYGQQRFTFGAAEDGTRADLPSVAYAFVRVGVDARIEIVEGLQVRPRVGWRPVLDAGDITTEAWFPRASVVAFDAALGLSYLLTDQLELSVTGEMQRYVYDLAVEVADPRVAGGAVDQYWAGHLGLTWLLSGP